MSAMKTVLQLFEAVLAQQWLWASLIGGGIAFMIQRLNFKHSLGEQRRVATMQTASQLRGWLIETSRVFEEQSIRYEPGPEIDQGPYGYCFPNPSDIPAFPFADGLERISSLRSDDAQSLFNLIERRRAAESEASLTWHVRDSEDAAAVFERLIAQVYLDSAIIYSKLAKQVGWTRTAVTENQLDEMRKRAAPVRDSNDRVDIPELVAAP